MEDMLANIKGGEKFGIGRNNRRQGELNIPTIDARYNDASLRVTSHYQEYMALSIAGLAVLGALIYQISKRQ